MPRGLQPNQSTWVAVLHVVGGRRCVRERVQVLVLVVLVEGVVVAVRVLRRVVVNLLVPVLQDRLGKDKWDNQDK